MDILLKNILDNGSIIASPSKEPDYNFQWTRDSAIVIKSLINVFKYSKNDKLLKIFDNYIDISLKHIKYHPGEPKFNIDGTPYKGEWGRPQNDGPALRGLICIELLKINKNRNNDLLKIINNDLEYTKNELENPTYDLWEEEYGYHFYTRILQYKFLYICKNLSISNLKTINDKYVEISRKRFFDHFDDVTLYSSYSVDGKILRKYDSSVLLGLEHVDYVIPGFSVNDIRIENYVKDLIKIFDNEYTINKKLNINFLGRYSNDKYFNGNPWIISTLSLYHYYFVINKINDLNKTFRNFIKFLKERKYLSEQIDKNSGENLSVEKLTWNYAEIILLINKIKNIDIEQYLDIFFN